MLSGESKAANAPHYLIGTGRQDTTVFDDASVDELMGDGGTDLFFARSANDSLTDLGAEDLEEI